MAQAHRAASFRKRLRSGQQTVGCFVKTPSPIIGEIMSRTPLDVICIDGEHAGFDRQSLDQLLAICLACGIPSLVRIPAPRPEYILGALDSGATGVVVPHIASRRDAEMVVKAAHYGRGGRGFAGTTRAGGFAGRTISEHLQKAAIETTVIAQIEDVEALAELPEIMSVDAIDAVFVGRIDLTVALGETDPQAQVVLDAVNAIVEAAREAEKIVGMFTQTVEEALLWREKGVSLFLLGSDHGFIAQGAARMMNTFRSGA